MTSSPGTRPHQPRNSRLRVGKARTGRPPARSAAYRLGLVKPRHSVTKPSAIKPIVRRHDAGGSAGALRNAKVTELASGPAVSRPAPSAVNLSCHPSGPVSCQPAGRLTADGTGRVTAEVDS